MAKTATKSAARTGAGPEPTFVRPNLVAIDLNAGGGRAGLSVGDRVRITGSGLYSGETVVIENLVGGVIPAAVVRTAAGQSRRVRTIDLEPVGAGPAAGAVPSTAASSDEPDQPAAGGAAG